MRREFKKSVKKPEIKKEFDHDFSWDSFNDFASSYSDSERKKLEHLYTESLNNIIEKEVIDAIVVGITNRDVVLNVGFKSDGIVPLSEFREITDLKIGDTVKVYVEERENIKGQLVLSRKKAKLIESWDNIQIAQDDGLKVDGFVKRRTKGGLIVDVFGNRNIFTWFTNRYQTY